VSVLDVQVLVLDKQVLNQSLGETITTSSIQRPYFPGEPRSAGSSFSTCSGENLPGLVEQVFLWAGGK